MDATSDPNVRVLIDAYPHGTLLRLDGDLSLTDRVGWTCWESMAIVRVNRRGLRGLYWIRGASPSYRHLSVARFRGTAIMLPLS